jgi:16S rRNA (uracil1498-N3)-methyltransferase
MTRRRWIADEVVGDRAFLRGSTSYHLARVLRARVGQVFDVVAEGRLCQGRVASVSAERVELDLADEVPAGDLQLEITLLLSIFKFDRMEWALEKATELGVSAIVPIIARRTEAHLASAAAKRRDRWERIVHDAAQQARRVSVPEIFAPMKLKHGLTDRKAGIVLSESEQDSSLIQMLREMGSPHAVALAFGPEGGWTNDELENFLKAGWRAASLGKTILRAETAVIAALAVTVAELT